jgi:hypothetical protein
MRADSHGRSFIGPEARGAKAIPGKDIREPQRWITSKVPGVSNLRE